MKHAIVQNVDTAETRAISAAVMLKNSGFEIIRRSIDNIPSVEYPALALPVGSVEFVRAFMEKNSIPEPVFPPYPTALKPFFHRFLDEVELGALRKVSAPGKQQHYPPLTFFVKPSKTKLFNGFVYRGDTADYDEHDKEQIDIMQELPPSTKVIISSKVSFVSEWRFYVAEVSHGYDIVGEARYDPEGEDDAPEPDREVVRKAIACMSNTHPYVLDFGVLSTGQTALVEANDAWAIGLYYRALGNADYLRFLDQRWQSIVASA